MILALALSAFACTRAPAASTPASAPAKSPMIDWAAVIIAGDDQSAHSDAPTQAFDNTRRDLAAALLRKGFSAAHLAQFSAAGQAQADDPGLIAVSLARLARGARSGCLFYLTSHGSPDGAVLGKRIASPRLIAHLLDAACPGRPTVVVISACFSGVFVPALAAPDRLVVTAARRDRSSFGCGEADRYPYFDGCLLESLPSATDFVGLALKTRACVGRREQETGMSPPSEPQILVGPAFRKRSLALPVG